MFNRKPRTPDPLLVSLDAEIQRTHSALQDLTAGNEDHARAVDQLSKLHALRIEHTNRRAPLSKDTLATVAGNVVVTGMVVGHERSHLITSKALQFLGRAK